MGIESLRAVGMFLECFCVFFGVVGLRLMCLGAFCVLFLIVWRIRCEQLVCLSSAATPMCLERLSRNRACASSVLRSCVGGACLAYRAAVAWWHIPSNRWRHMPSNIVPLLFGGICRLSQPGGLRQWGVGTGWEGFWPRVHRVYAAASHQLGPVSAVETPQPATPQP